MGDEVCEVSGGGENPTHSEKYLCFVYFIFSCEHVYLYFHTAVRWLQWLFLTKLVEFGQHLCRCLSRDINSCFIFRKKKKKKAHKNRNPQKNQTKTTPKKIHLYFQFKILYCQTISFFKRNSNACESSLIYYSN